VAAAHKAYSEWMPVRMGPDTLSVAAAAVLRAANAHVKWAELDQHGYGVLDVTPDRCRMDWYFLTDRTNADSGAYLAKSFSVDSGVARLRQEVPVLSE
jgi:alkaline phosphatase D